MKLHETMNIVHGAKAHFHETGADECDSVIKVMRVEGGWIYGVDTDSPVFVPQTKTTPPDKSVKEPDVEWLAPSRTPLTEGKRRDVPKPPPSTVIPEGKTVSLFKFWTWFE